MSALCPLGITNWGACAKDSCAENINAKKRIVFMVEFENKIPVKIAVSLDAIKLTGILKYLIMLYLHH
jgi:hypothetical protein